jgi:hypothetical protein
VIVNRPAMARMTTDRGKAWILIVGVSLTAVMISWLASAGSSGASPTKTIPPFRGSTLTTVTPRPGGPCRGSQIPQSPHHVSIPRILRAAPLPSMPSPQPNYQREGAFVPQSNIHTTTTDGKGTLFGLAVYRRLLEATYPALSTNGGHTWRIDGPLFWVAAADGAAATSDVGALGSHGAYFWGRGGNLVKVTIDDGVRWWVRGFSAGVYKVSASHGALRTVALGNQVSCTAFRAFLYVSTDSGRTWRFQASLHNVTQ